MNGFDLLLQLRRTVRVKSCYNPSYIDMFDNKKKYPDVTVVFAGIEKPLGLHCSVLGPASGTFASLFDGGESPHGTYDGDKRHVVWKAKGVKNKLYQNVLVKWLRFCYGEDQSFSCEECAAAFAVLNQLQLTCREDVQNAIVTFMVDVAKADIEAGVKMLRSCAMDYDECHKDDRCRVDMKLAKAVLTKENMLMCYDAVVSDCLLVLPASYLDAAKYGPMHTPFSEFNIRRRYVKYHCRSLNEEERRKVMSKCDISTLNNAEMAVMGEMGMLSREELVYSLCQLSGERGEYQAFCLLQIFLFIGGDMKCNVMI